MTGIMYIGVDWPCWREYQLSWAFERSARAQATVDRAYYPPEGSGIQRIITLVPMHDFYKPRAPDEVPWWDK